MTLARVFNCTDGGAHGGNEALAYATRKERELVAGEMTIRSLDLAESPATSEAVALVSHGAALVHAGYAARRTRLAAEQKPARQHGQRTMVERRTAKTANAKTATADRYRGLRRDGFQRSEVVTMLYGEQSRFSGKHGRGNFTRWLGVAALEEELTAQK